MALNIKLTENLNSNEAQVELGSALKLQLINKLTEDFRSWNDCTHNECLTGYMNSLIDTISVISNSGGLYDESEVKS